ncbi:MAG: hypothetical protein AAB074_08660 [Planctomycetota bacterium]
MSCEDIRNLALLAACGEAGEAEAASVREHSAKCPACASEIRALHEGLELLKHMPREAPSREAREQIGSMLLREAPRPAPRSVRGWAIAAAALMAVTATALAWKLGAWDATKPATVARGDNPQPTETTKVATHQPVKKVRKPVSAASLSTSFADEDVDSLAEDFKDLGGSRATVAAKPDPSAVWYGQNSNAVDSIYDTLEQITASPDKF